MTIGRFERGIALSAVMPFLVAIMVLGLTAASFSMHGERLSRNERDYNLAFQAAEAALRDAELDITNGSRQALLESLYPFPSACVTTDPKQSGLCGTPLDQDPIWRTIDLADKSKSTRFGEFTGARCLPRREGDTENCPRGATSVQGVARQPRYVLEKLMTPGLKQKGSTEFVYRITAIGFGARETTRVVLQSLYRPS